MNKRNYPLIYYPVSPINDKIACKYTSAYFANAASPVSKKELKKLVDKNITCDSGGLQAFRAISKGKIFHCSSMVSTVRDDPDILMFGIIDHCREYARINSEVAMCIDLPTYTDDSDFDYYYKLSESIEARDQMTKLAKYLCPDTRLGIVLQPRNPYEVKNYFCFIYTPSVNLYAYPIRSFRNKIKDALGNAFVLSFLSDMGVKQVHFLGSNAPPVIWLLAHAVALRLFEKVSFDSHTWNQKALSGIRYLHPETLSPVPSKKEGQLHPKANLRTELEKYPSVFEKTIGCFNPPEWVIAEEWLGLLNIRIIEEFKDFMLELAFNDHLESFIRCFNKYGNKDVMIQALELLNESKMHGHEFIERQYGARIQELYS